ncbi:MULTISPECIES: hypothetical protein [unclassified Mesorhizobium]|uniref:hypothetical protein n=1 Tax=unclassified Mesorhizobium TaxID=325217 RepID=UPI0004CECD70|nr:MULTISPECIES: hypothetical protein [unclassified Mesorhizobium]WJI43611.1 hypothetical protein NL532_23665 [Mesorhizobium sp. C120A]
MTAFWNFLTSLQSPATTFLFGLVALIIGSLFNSQLNRRRDDRLRAEEAKAVAAALYGEILPLRQEVAILAKVVAKTYFAEGTQRNPSLKFDETLLERNTLADPLLYRSLASKLGLLEPELVLAITKFHAEYQSVRNWLPKLIENEKRGFSYSVLSLLHPAHEVVLGISPALRRIEQIVGITTPAADPEMKDAIEAIDIESEAFADVISS